MRVGRKLWKSTRGSMIWALTGPSARSRRLKALAPNPWKVLSANARPERSAVSTIDELAWRLNSSDRFKVSRSPTRQRSALDAFDSTGKPVAGEHECHGRDTGRGSARHPADSR